GQANDGKESARQADLPESANAGSSFDFSQHHADPDLDVAYAGAIHAIGGGFPSSHQLRGEIESHRLGVFVELRIGLRRIELASPIEALARRGHENLRRR